MADIVRLPAQTMLNRLGRVDPATARGKLRLLRWRGLRALLLRISDPLVAYSFEGHPLRLPFSHDLPLIRQQHPQYMTNVTRVAQQVAVKYPDAAGVDIGANVGDTIIAIRKAASMPLLGIEGNAAYYELLKANVTGLRDVELDQSFVGYGIATLSGFLRAEHGTASFISSASPGQVIVPRPLIEILRAHPRFLNARFLKIDTDGLDCAILKAALDWLAGARPVIYFEYDPSAYARYDPSGFEIFAGLCRAGYSTALIWDNRGDYLLACDLSDRRLLEDVHQYFAGRQSKVYCDIAVFHDDDRDVMEAARAAEIDFFSRARRAP